VENRQEVSFTISVNKKLCQFELHRHVCMVYFQSGTNNPFIVQSMKTDFKNCVTSIAYAIMEHLMAFATGIGKPVFVKAKTQKTYGNTRMI
jgi:hypothetical protein